MTPIPDSFKLIPMKSSYKAGLFAEFWARMYLRLHGYAILKSRYVTGRHTGRAEIDIIARRNKTIVFIEVKNRPDAAAGIKSVAFSQRGRLRRAAVTFLARNYPHASARFDIIVVSGLKIHWFRNAV